MSKASDLRIPMTSVKHSSNVEAHGYDAATRTLAVRFKGGGEYRFTDVPADLADKFAAAESKGSFFAKSIRGHFTSTKQPPPAKKKT